MHRQSMYVFTFRLSIVHPERPFHCFGSTGVHGVHEGPRKYTQFLLISSKPPRKVYAVSFICSPRKKNQTTLDALSCRIRELCNLGQRIWSIIQITCKMYLCMACEYLTTCRCRLCNCVSYAKKVRFGFTPLAETNMD
jgi:hypothetical protein